MKSLKKLAAIGALISTMGFAKAEQKEVDFAPTAFEGGEIEKIELVNGQLLVRSNGRIQGTETPYSYVGTNTQHFAENAFAQGGLTNVAQYVHAGHGKIYMTETGNTDKVWTTDVLSKKELNGVKQGVQAVDLTQDAAARAILDAAVNGNSNLVKVVGDDVYTVADNRVLKNGQPDKDYIPDMAGKRKDELAIVNGRGYVLAEGTVYSGLYPIVAENVDSIAATEGGKLLVSSEGKIKIFDPSKAIKQWTNVEGLGSATANGGEAIKSVAMSADGKMMYYATAKKLGYKTLD